MHFCLQITEILTNIFNSYSDNKPDKQTLLHLALVCKIFCEPALDALWKFQPSFYTLVKTFPSDLWEETERPATLSFKRIPTPSDWPRFQFYARRMNRISFPQSTNLLVMSRYNGHTSSGIKSCKLIPSVFQAIYDSLGLGHSHRPLLQNLKELECEEYLNHIPSMRTACMFLGPRLKKLSLSVPYPTTGFEAFFNTVKSCCPSLEILRVKDKYRSEEVGGAVSNLVCGLSRLRDLSISDVMLNCKAFLHLASLPNLQVLHVPLPVLQNPLPVVPFPALKRFYVYAASIADAEKCVSSSSSLEFIIINVSIIPPPHVLHTFLTTVSRDTLTTVVLQDLAARDVRIRPSHSLKAHTLIPLLQCPNLMDVSIEIQYTLEAVDNALIKDMAMAWPCLRRFALDSGMSWRSSVNLEGLLYLAQHCRALVSVNLQFDVSLPINRTDLESLSSEICNESVVYLRVGRSPIVDPPAVASFLSNVYPNLKLYHSWYSNSALGWDPRDSPASMEMSKRWEELDRLLTVFANNRK